MFVEAARRALAHHRQADGVQARDGGREELAEAEGRDPVAEGRGRCHLPGRDRGRRTPRSPRRLINLRHPKSRIAPCGLTIRLVPEENSRTRKAPQTSCRITGKSSG